MVNMTFRKLRKKMRRSKTDLEKYNKSISDIDRLGKLCISEGLEENDIKRYRTLKKRGALQLGEICINYGFNRTDLELLRALKG